MASWEGQGAHDAPTASILPLAAHFHMYKQGSAVAGSFNKQFTSAASWKGKECKIASQLGTGSFQLIGGANYTVGNTCQLKAFEPSTSTVSRCTLRPKLPIQPRICYRPACRWLTTQVPNQFCQHDCCCRTAARYCQLAPRLPFKCGLEITSSNPWFLLRCPGGTLSAGATEGPADAQLQ